MNEVFREAMNKMGVSGIFSIHPTRQVVPNVPTNFRVVRKGRILRGQCVNSPPKQEPEHRFGVVSKLVFERVERLDVDLGPFPLILREICKAIMNSGLIDLESFIQLRHSRESVIAFTLLSRDHITRHESG